jgi:hypothetical protein
VSQPHRPSAMPSSQLTEGPSPIRGLLKDVHVRLADGLRRIPAGTKSVWGPDHEHSPHPVALRLRANGQSFEWVAVTFPGWSMWHLHLGLVPRGPGVLALGVHWHDAVTHLLPSALADLAARGIKTSYDDKSREHQADVLILASSSFPHPRAVQILSDAALDLADLLNAPLAVSPTAPSAHREPSYDL